MIERHPISDRASWLARRAQDLTASDMAAAIGDSPFKTALGLYAEKTGHLMPKPATPLMERGSDMEHAAIAKLRRERPDWEIKFPYGEYLRDPELRLGATPDAARINPQGKPTNLQIKVVNRHTFDKEWMGGPPLHYLLQTATEGLLMDAEASIIVVLVVDYASLELFYFDVPRHPEAEAHIKEHAKAFWDNVATGRRPTADLKRDAKTLAALYPQSEKEPVLDLSIDNALPEKLEQYLRLKAEIATREAEIKEIEVYVKDKMGPAELAELPGFRILWRSHIVKEHIRKEHIQRPLRITEVKQEEEEQAA